MKKQFKKILSLFLIVSMMMCNTLPSLANVIEDETETTLLFNDENNNGVKSIEDNEKNNEIESAKENENDDESAEADKNKETSIDGEENIDENEIISPSFIEDKPSDRILDEEPEEDNTETSKSLDDDYLNNNIEDMDETDKLNFESIESEENVEDINLVENNDSTYITEDTRQDYEDIISTESELIIYDNDYIDKLEENESIIISSESELEHGLIEQDDNLDLKLFDESLVNNDRISTISDTDNIDDKFIDLKSTISNANFGININEFGATTFKVKFNTRGGNIILDKTFTQGSTLLESNIPTPIRGGFTFVGWYLDEECTSSISFPYGPLNNDLTLYARWSKNSSSNTIVEWHL